MPAVALAKALTAKGARVEVTLDERAIRFEEHFGAVAIHRLPAGTPGAAGMRGKVKGVLGLVAGLWKAFTLLRRLKPAVVVGFGGYPSVPSVLAAQLQGIPTALHEQNAVLGWANAVLAKKANVIALGFPVRSGLDEAQAKRARVVGNPVREEIEALHNTPFPHVKKNGQVHVFVMGGSLGATVLSKAVPKALSLLPEDIQARISVLQQCRQSDIDTTRAGYAKTKVTSDLTPFVQDVAGALERAHIFIGRSGASTVAEVSLAGRSAVYIPYPGHKDQQQKWNAHDVCEAGGAWCFDEKTLSPQALAQALADQLRTLIDDPQALTQAAQGAKAAAYPKAAKLFADDILTLAASK